MRISRFYHLLVILFLPAAFGMPAARAEAAPVTYYVSSSGGSDSNTGLSTGAPIATIAKVNSLTLQPGDRVLFKCGDTWRAEQLVLSESGLPGAEITFGSYPAGCANQPVLSGARPVSGWTLDAGSVNVYRADLSPAMFPNGINQLFRAGQRLTLGRWPNLDAANAGYAFVDAHTAGSSQITDNQLPPGNWTGAIAHIKNIRWSMLDRQVTATSGHSLPLNKGLSCLTDGWKDCVGWGYFINNHRATLDQDGEWYYDESTRRVYLYSASGAPANIEGSVVLEVAEPLRHGGVMLSDGSATAYVTLDNLAVVNWFNHGIGTPGGMNANTDIYHHLTLRNLTIRDVDGAGVNLSSWLEKPLVGPKGLRGGHHLLFSNNVIDGANSFGISGYFAESTFEHNTIRNIAVVKNLGKSGMGCGLTTGECTENGDGLRIRTYQPLYSGFGNALRYNTFEFIGYNGVDVFGHDTTLERNVFTRTCDTKADCGAVRVFGDDDLASTPVYNIHLIENIIYDIRGNVDGCHASRPPFGMGLYIDHYSRDVETRGNTIIDTSVTGILYQNSTGVIRGNTVFNASNGTAFSAQISLAGDATRATLDHNSVYGLTANAWTLYVYAPSSNVVASDWNAFFQPYVNQHIAYSDAWKRLTFAGWQSLSGKDANSTTNWFTQAAGEASRGKIFYNKSASTVTIDLGSRQYLDLWQAPVAGSLSLAPFSSRILVDNGPAGLALLGMQPGMWGASDARDFTLQVMGTGFTSSSVVRWNGADRPTTWVSSTRLNAAISAADVGAVGEYRVTVYDPAHKETAPLVFRVVEKVYPVYLPVVGK